MKLLSAIITALLLVPAGVRADQTVPVRVRVLTYNIHHGEGRDGKLDLARQAEVMKAAEPDVIALQEVDQGTERASGVMQMDELARMMGMHATFGRTLDLPGGAYGLAILSRWSMLSTDTEPLPSAVGHEPRGALTAFIRAGRNGPLFQLTSTHFDTSRDGNDRMDQAMHLDAMLGIGSTPSILAGDFNARWDTDIMQVFAPNWMNPSGGEPLPAPAANGRPRGRGDFVLYRPEGSWKVVENTILEDNVASDHRAVLTVLEWVGSS